MSASYSFLSSRNKHRVDLSIAVDIAQGGMNQNPFNYGHLKGLPDKEYLTRVRDIVAEQIFGLQT